MVLDLLKSRYSVRKFSDKPVEQDKLELILEAGRIAPTAKNLQPQQIVVCRSKEAIKRINEVSPCIYGASTVLIICGNTDVCWTSEDKSYSSLEIDTTLVCSQMLMQAEELDIGSCIVLMFDRDKTSKLFGLDSNIKPLLLVPLGYKNLEPSERHTLRKPLKDTVKFV